MGYSTVETLLDEVSNHIAASNISRQSRGSISQKSGVSMRVVKPNSASNSPRNSVGLGRRMTDGAYRRRLAMLEQGTQGSASFISHDGLHPPPSTRPVSWHPASHIPQPVPFQPTYAQQYSQANTNYQLYDVQAIPPAYSGYNSPASNFSPVSGPSNGYDQQQYITQNRPHTYNPYSTYDMNQQHQMAHAVQIPQPSYMPVASDNVDPSMYSHFDWSNFATNGFETASTTPPTPENFLPIQHPEPTFPAEDAIPYHPLDDSDEGEELIGMGLYDETEVKSPPSDPHLDNYRALMMSQLLGTPYRRPEPVGKGLKLEEGWNPPSDDEDDSDEDGEGEDEEVPAARTNNGEAVSTHTLVGNFLPTSAPQNSGMQNYSRDGWLQEKIAYICFYFERFSIALGRVWVGDSVKKAILVTVQQRQV